MGCCYGWWDVAMGHYFYTRCTTFPAEAYSWRFLCRHCIKRQFPYSHFKGEQYHVIFYKIMWSVLHRTFLLIWRSALGQIRVWWDEVCSFGTCCLRNICGISPLSWMSMHRLLLIPVELITISCYTILS